ncbi:hypothetical protein HDC94_001967 [Leifsonia sp. AK011]|nr:hypothetical protein [Leifsonia sp. AK011]
MTRPLDHDEIRMILNAETNPEQMTAQQVVDRAYGADIRTAYGTSPMTPETAGKANR